MFRSGVFVGKKTGKDRMNNLFSRLQLRDYTQVCSMAKEALRRFRKAAMRKQGGCGQSSWPGPVAD
jgi:hypothetical protein